MTIFSSEAQSKLRFKKQKSISNPTIQTAISFLIQPVDVTFIIIELLNRIEIITFLFTIKKTIGNLSSVFIVSHTAFHYLRARKFPRLCLLKKSESLLRITEN